MGMSRLQSKRLDIIILLCKFVHVLILKCQLNPVFEMSIISIINMSYVKKTIETEA